MAEERRMPRVRPQQTRSLSCETPLASWRHDRQLELLLEFGSHGAPRSRTAASQHISSASGARDMSGVRPALPYNDAGAHDSSGSVVSGLRPRPPVGRKFEAG